MSSKDKRRRSGKSDQTRTGTLFGVVSIHGGLSTYGESDLGGGEGGGAGERNPRRGSRKARHVLNVMEPERWRCEACLERRPTKKNI